MRFFFPDSQDQIDPSFDFHTEQRSPFRIRQRDDLYAHEVFSKAPYQGMLVSKAMVDGVSGSAGRYSHQQRQRLYRVGIREFFRLDAAPGPRLNTMGDCGAFTYVREEVPPYSVDEVIDFYEGCGFDAGLSVDHVVLGFDAAAPLSEDFIDLKWRNRQEMTLGLAEEFFTRHLKRGCRFEAVGVAQGWSPDSYATAVARLQHIGYRRIALGGLVSLKTPEIFAVLRAIDRERLPDTELHLLGVTRCEHAPSFRSFGVTSFDSTSPFRQAFKDDRDNYYTATGSWVALRIPQVDGNAKLQRKIRAGAIDHALARQRERVALDAVHAFDRGEAGLEETVEALGDYELLWDERHDRRATYRKVLKAAAWKRCRCEVCRQAGIDVIVFRGTERNKRRGFHNLHVFASRVRRELRRDVQPAVVAA